jgi:hypothetical protein
MGKVPGYGWRVIQDLGRENKDKNVTLLQAFLQRECIMLILAQMQNPCHSLLQIIIIYSNTSNLKEEFSLTQTHSSYHANIKPTYTVICLHLPSI